MKALFSILKKYRLLSIIVIIFLLLLFNCLYAEINYYHIKRDMRDPKRIEYVVFETLLMLYEKTGTFPVSMDNYDNSHYYPYQQPYTFSYFDFTLTKSKNKIQYTAYDDNVNLYFFASINTRIIIHNMYPAMSKTIETKTREEYSLSGVINIETTINEMRKEIASRNDESMGSDSAKYFTLKAQYQSGLNFCYPGNRNELDQYIKFLEEVNQGSLYDSWGSLFKFSISNNITFIRSAGKDKKFNTGDDIVFDNHSYVDYK